MRKHHRITRRFSVLLSVMATVFLLFGVMSYSAFLLQAEPLRDMAAAEQADQNFRITFTEKKTGLTHEKQKLLQRIETARLLRDYNDCERDESGEFIETLISHYVLNARSEVEKYLDKAETVCRSQPVFQLLRADIYLANGAAEQADEIYTSLLSSPLALYALERLLYFEQYRKFSEQKPSPLWAAVAGGKYHKAAGILVKRLKKSRKAYERRKLLKNLHYLTSAYMGDDQLNEQIKYFAALEKNYRAVLANNRYFNGFDPENLALFRSVKRPGSDELYRNLMNFYDHRRRESLLGANFNIITRILTGQGELVSGALAYSSDGLTVLVNDTGISEIRKADIRMIMKTELSKTNSHLAGINDLSSQHRHQ